MGIPADDQHASTAQRCLGVGRCHVVEQAEAAGADRLGMMSGWAHDGEGTVGFTRHQCLHGRDGVHFR